MKKNILICTLNIMFLFFGCNDNNTSNKSKLTKNNSLKTTKNTTNPCILDELLLEYETIALKVHNLDVYDEDSMKKWDEENAVFDKKWTKALDNTSCTNSDIMNSVNKLFDITMTTSDILMSRY